jgi:octaprenyl-diphosphate synthase
MIAGDATLDRGRYEMVIDRKTAALISWCTSVGGLLDPAYVAALERYGRELGYAFQITDDVIDYIVDESQSGKTRGQDLREGKMTLPLLIACEADAGLHSIVRRALAAGPPVDDSVARHVVEAVVGSTALDDCRTIARGHADRAVAELDHVPGSPARDALIALAHYVVRRSS